MALPPPDPQPPGDAGAGPSMWRRFQARPRWQRWNTYGAATFIALVGIGLAIGDRDSTSEVTAVPVTASVTTDQVTTNPTPTNPNSASSATTRPITAAPTTPATTAIATATPPTTPPPPTTSPPPTTVPGSLAALDVLAVLPVGNEHDGGYDRALFPEGLDGDGDGCATRAEVLIRDSLTPAQVDPSGCHVVAGDWLSVYDGQAVTDPAQLEVDHVVALKEAWDSGAWQWDTARRAAFANDLEDRGRCGR